MLEIKQGKPIMVMPETTEGFEFLQDIINELGIKPLKVGNHSVILKIDDGNNVKRLLTERKISYHWQPMSLD